MQELVAFWRHCGLITGQRTPPSPQWPNPKAEVRGLEMTAYLKNRLQVIETGFDRLNKSRLIGITRWKEAALTFETEPSASDTPLPQSLLDELHILWQGREGWDPEEVEDKMIARISQWRRFKHQQRLEDRLGSFPQLGSDADADGMVQKAGSPGSPGCSRQEYLSGDSVTSTIMTSEGTRQPRGKLRVRALSAQDKIYDGRGPGNLAR